LHDTIIGDAPGSALSGQIYWVVTRGRATGFDLVKAATSLWISFRASTFELTMVACASTQKLSVVFAGTIEVTGAKEQPDSSKPAANVQKEEFEAIFGPPLSARYTLLSLKVDLAGSADRNRRVTLLRVMKSTRLGQTMLIAALLLVAGCDRGPSPLPPESLQIRINLLCSTCDDFLRCEVSGVTPQADSYRLYRLREKSFWAQIATIWDYLVQLVRRKTTDVRPLSVYENQGERRRVSSVVGKARIDAAAGLIQLPDSIVDMRNGEWRTPTGELQGQCRTLPRREGYAWVRAMLGRDLPAGRAP
jgi:hypothetical protein